MKEIKNPMEILIEKIKEEREDPNNPLQDKLMNMILNEYARVVSEAKSSDDSAWYWEKAYIKKENSQIAISIIISALTISIAIFLS